MIARSIICVIRIFVAVAITTGYGSPDSTTGSNPEVTDPALGISDSEILAAAALQAALTFIQATQGWADAGRPGVLADPPAGNGTPAPGDSGTSPFLGHDQTAAPAALTTTTDSPDAVANSGYLISLSAEESREERNDRLIKAAEDGMVGELEALLAEGADASATGGGFFTMSALHWAASNGHVEAARRLLAHGAAVDARDSVQETPLHWAAGNGHAAVVRLLLAASADPNARNVDGRTPLHWAASNGRAEVVAVLLEAGADREATTSLGQTPLDLAEWYDRWQVIDLLTAR